jgi:hypothetical protein
LHVKLKQPSMAMHQHHTPRPIAAAVQQIT